MTSCSCCLTITNNWHQFHIVLGMQHFLFIAAIIDPGHNESGQSIASPRVLRVSIPSSCVDVDDYASCRARCDQ